MVHVPANCRHHMELWGLVSHQTNRGVPVPVADNSVDRPLVDVVIDAIDADNVLSNEVKYCLLAARALECSEHTYLPTDPRLVATGVGCDRAC